MPTKTKTTSALARELHAQNPTWTPTEIAVHLGDKGKRSVVAKALKTTGVRTGRPRVHERCGHCGGTGRVKT